MPIVQHQLVQANNALAGYGIAKELARQSANQFAAVRGAGANLAGGSCCAALAVAPNQQLGFAAAQGLQYAVVYGNSQMAQGGLVNVLVGAHAERAALTAAGGQGGGGHGVNLYVVQNEAVLFVELEPCQGCANWLNGQGGGVPNPFDGIINGQGATTLHVWYRWPYPGGGGVAAMNVFHALALANQLADINNNW